MNGLYTNTNTNNSTNGTGHGNGHGQLLAFKNRSRWSSTNKSEEDDPGYKKFLELFVKDSKIIPIGSFTIVLFHNWFDNLPTQYKSLTTEYRSGRIGYSIRFETRTRGARRVVCIKGTGHDKRTQLYDIICQLHGVTKFQMMEGGIDGLDTMNTIEASNTIVTEPLVEITSGVPETGPQIGALSSTAPDYSLNEMTNRFDLFKSGTIRRDEDFKLNVSLPGDILDDKQKKNSANLALFKSFIYSNLEMEIRIIVNAPKFGQGRLIVSWFPDPHFNVAFLYNDFASCLQRPHVFIDLNANNQAVIRVPQNIRRSFIRNVMHNTSNTGTIWSLMANLQICTVIPYTANSDQPAAIPYQLLYRFVDAKFYGMSFAAELQMDKVVGMAGDVYPPIKVAEKLLKRTGWIGNQDKPFEGSQSMFTPIPRRDFCTGNGLSDALPLFFDRTSTVTTLTEYMNPMDPTDMLAIARIPGYLGKFEWNTQQAASTVLYEWMVSPTSRTGWETELNQATRDRLPSRRPTPLDYVSSQYAFWRGTLKLKFLFICTPFHTGSLQFEISYNRVSDIMSDMASTYTQTFDLVEDREFELEIPYIYDTPWRQTMKQFQWPCPPGDTPTGFIPKTGEVYPANYLAGAQAYPPGIEFVSNTRMTVRCLNPLTPIQSVSPNVSVVVLVSAGKDYELNAVVPNFYCNPSYARLDASNDYSGIFQNQKTFPLFADNPQDYSTFPTEWRVPRTRTKPQAVGRGQKFDYVANPMLSWFEKIKSKAWKVPAPRFSANGAPLVKAVMTDAQIADYKKRTGVEPPDVKYKRIDPLKSSRIQLQGDVFGPTMTTRHFHNTDEQNAFKVLLRRNYMLTSIRLDKRDSGQVNLWNQPHQESDEFLEHWYDTHSRLYIPIFPPTHGVVSNRFSSSWATPISTIPTLFRHWRGSMRYVIIAKGTKMPIYVAYLPNLGTTYFGNKINGHKLTAANGGNQSWTGKNYRAMTFDRLAQSGLATEILLPDVNSSLSITVPFDTMFNRCVTTIRPDYGNKSTISDFTAREESTYHSGHLIIESDASADLDIFVSVGDDFQMMNFVGTMKYDGRSITTIPDMWFRNEKDGRVTDATDFHFNEPSVSSTNVQTPYVVTAGDYIPKIEYQMFGISELGNDVRAGLREMNDLAKKFTDEISTDSNTMVHGVLDNVSELTDNVKKLTENSQRVSDNFMLHMEKISDNFEKQGSRVGSLTDSMSRVVQLMTPMIEKTSEIFDSKLSFAKRAFDFSRDFMFDLILLLRQFDFVNFGILFVKYIAKVLNVGFEELLPFGEKMAQTMKKICGLSATEQGSADDATPTSLFGFFVALLASVLKIVNLPEKKYYDFGSKFKDYIFDVRNVNYMNSMISLVERVFKIFLGSVRYIQNYTNTEETVREVMRSEQVDIERFCVEVDQITNPANARIAQRADVKAKTWRNFMYAKYLTKRMVQCQGNAASAVIMKYVHKINTYCETNWNKLACCPVRYEPLVLCFAGPSNVGKSYLSNFILLKLLHAIGYKRDGGQPIFTRAPGRKHWDGFTLDKQAVVFDDWMNISNPEQVVEQVSDLYELKSTCDFLPPMAAVEEKGLRGNPRLVSLLTNSPFPRSCINTVCNTEEAVYRRRDVLIWSKLRPEFENVKIREALTDEQSENFSHLLFAIGDSTTPHDIDLGSLKWFGYDELEPYLVERFLDYNQTELRNVKKRLDALCADMPEEIRNLADPMEIYSLRQFESMHSPDEFLEMMPSKLLEKHVRECLEKLGEVNFQGDSDDFEKLMSDSGYSSATDTPPPKPELMDLLFDDENIGRILHFGYDVDLGIYYFELPVWRIKLMYSPMVAIFGTNLQRMARCVAHQQLAGVPFDQLGCPACWIDATEVPEFGKTGLLMLDQVGPGFAGSKTRLFSECERHKHMMGEDYITTTQNIYGEEYAWRNALAYLFDSPDGKYELRDPTYDVHYLNTLLSVCNSDQFTGMNFKKFGPAYRVPRKGGFEKILCALGRGNLNGYMFSMQFSTCFEEHGKNKYSADRLLQILQHGLLLSKDEIEIQVWKLDTFGIQMDEFKFNCDEFEARHYQRIMPECKWSRYLEKKMTRNLDVPMDNDDQFPMWEAQGYNELGYSPTLRDAYNKKNRVTATDWLNEYIDDRVSKYDRVVSSCYQSPVEQRDGFMTALHLIEGQPGTVLDDNDVNWATHKIQWNETEKIYVNEFAFKGTWNHVRMERVTRCHHCRKYAFFQRGTNEHHICFDCYKKVTCCDYCLSHDARKGEDEFYWSAFGFCVFTMDKTKPWLAKLLRMVRAMCHALLFYRIVRKLFDLPNAGDLLKLGIRGLANMFHKCSSSYFQGDECFNDVNFREMMFKVDHRVDSGVCLHHELFGRQLEDMDYDREQWLFGPIDNIQTVSVYPCKSNCSLLSESGLQKYEQLCHSFAEVNRFKIGYLIAADDASIESWLVNVPYWMLPLGHKYTMEYDPGKFRYSKIRSRVCSWLNIGLSKIGINPTWSWTKILISCGAAILSVVAAVRGVFELVGWMKRGLDSTSSEQGVPPGYSRADSTRHFKRKQNPNPKTKPKWDGASSKNIEQQSQSQYFAALSKYVFRNQLVFEIYVNGNRQQTSMTAVGIRNRAALMPKHYYKALCELNESGLEKLEIRLFQPAFPAIKTRTYQFDPIDFICSENSDMCIFFAPKTVGEFVNIVKYIQTERDCEMALPSGGVFLRCSGNDNPNLREIDIRLIGYEKSIEMNTGEGYNDVLSYEYSEPGACGSLVLKRNSTRPIMAMHFAGTNSSSWVTRGYGMVISQETFSDIDFGVGAVVERIEPDVTYPVEDAKIQLPPDFVEVQSMFALEHEVHLATESKIRPSLLNQYDGPPITRPCFLSRFDAEYPHEHSPMVAGCAKHGVLTKNFKTSDVNEARDVLYAAKYAGMKPSMAQPKRLTFAEAIRGFAIEGYEPLKLSTSMGYPWIFTPNKQKKDYVTVTDEQEIELRRVFIDRKALNALRDDEMMRQSGIIPFLPYVDELKDERRKFKKVFTLGGTRVFCMSPFTTTIACRQNFLHFAAAYKNNRFKLQHAVGVSRDGPGWSIIANNLLRISNNIVDLDYSNFGPGYNAMVCAAAHDIIQRWTLENVSGVNVSEMTVLGEEHYNSVHVAGDLVYQQLSGGPSGDSLTVVKNGIVNELYVLLGWKILAERIGYVPENGIWSDFFFYVYLLTYGDDAIMAIADRIFPWFNRVTLTEVFAEYGIVATSADKGAAITPGQTLEESTFLKSGFVRHPKFDREWLAPIDMDSITECPRWVFSSPNLELATVINCDQAVRLAYGHGEAKFNEIRDRINSAMCEKNLPPILLTWRELDKNFFPQYYIKN